MPTRKTPPKPASKKTESKQVTPSKPSPRKTSSKKVVTPPAPEEVIAPQEGLPAAAPAEPEELAPAPSAPVNPVAPVPPLPPVPPVPAVAPVLPQLSQSQWERPGKLQAIAIMTLLNGIFNILYGLIITAVVVLGTLFIGIICSWLTILPTVLGIFEVIYAAKLLANPPQPVKPSKTIAILEIVAVLAGNVVSAVVGILALVFYDDPAVKGFFARLNRHA